MSKIHPNFLKIIHLTLLKRSQQYNYSDFPRTLSSLTIDNPTSKQIEKDYSSLVSHFKHPIFIDFVPSHEQLKHNNYLPWFNLYQNRNNS